MGLWSREFVVDYGDDKKCRAGRRVILSRSSGGKIVRTKKEWDFLVFVLLWGLLRVKGEKVLCLFFSLVLISNFFET